MSHISRKFLFLILLILSSSVWARSASLLVGLHIQSVRLDLQYANTVRNTDLSSLDLLWSESLNHWLDGSLVLSTFELTQSNNPIPAGQTSSGNALGLGMRFHLYHGERLKLHTDLAYRYADATSDVSGQKVDTRWHQFSGSLEADIRIVQYTYLSLALGAVTIHGDENATGTVTASQSFQSKNAGFGRLGLLIGIDPASHVGLEVSSGAISGGRIYFQRWF